MMCRSAARRSCGRSSCQRSRRAATRAAACACTKSLARDATYTNGRVIWTSGLNNGLEMEIKALGATCKLVLPMPFNIAISDTVNMVKGCAKTKAACQAYSNYVNFQGFHDLPGIDHMLQYPSLR